MTGRLNLVRRVEDIPLIAIRGNGVDHRLLVANSLGGLLARRVATRLPGQVVGIALIAPVVGPVCSRSRRTLSTRAVSVSASGTWGCRKCARATPLCGS